MGLILGIDTSNYTTSVALMDEEGNLITEVRELLTVQKGERGLRQSEAVFKHVEQFPEVINGLDYTTFREELVKVVVSDRPRNDIDSYMPVFRVGEGQAKSIAKLFQIPLQKFSHQEGHLMAGIWSAGGPNVKEFLAVHLSGGTTDILKVTKKNDNGFRIEKLGSAVDLHAGQFVDRVGVKLGLNFPAGPELEEMAKSGKKGEVILPSSVNGYNISFSGPNSAAMRAIEAGKCSEDIALAVQSCIAKALEKVLRLALSEHKIEQTLIVGGVAANQYIRQRLKKKLEHPAVGGRLFFAEPKFSSDNAVGIAALGLDSI
ncbi:Kae1-like domain-containing protein [Selenihalanaerobacter shriftii]|uniref:N(6)-L-threonylcarbamoyladenine synthase n=1 Tax=Selenihalanaerobacter shriftii TaxID=142842 RepID=A0A1T4P233_9FIRM|nr:O-sialoglycoprotein endopeptidase [Selenihalanaerobacter shriftii]SJZ85584.1 N6-L-threonylcarbamoyladenine synthase [Selenihalanaerobacter shriftii]